MATTSPYPDDVVAYLFFFVIGSTRVPQNTTVRGAWWQTSNQLTTAIVPWQRRYSLIALLGFLGQ